MNSTEQFMERMWNDYFHIKGHRFPRNPIAIRYAMKEALMDMDYWRYRDRKRYREALVEYADHCCELKDREWLEHNVEIAMLAAY